MCLRNAQTKSLEASESLPWLASKVKKKEDKLPKVSKAPLWSPPIPSDIGLKCITMNYQINGDSRTSNLYSLTVLQQQDG